jgi:phospholipid/cholesterol/gamma-HCH transport system substrate-binding protein
VSLGGAVKGAPPITEPGPEGVPVIPAEPGGLGEILASAPLLLERVATLTDRLTRLLSDENQASITSILANTDRMSAQLADMGPSCARRWRAQAHAGAVDRNARRVRGTLRTTDTCSTSEGTSLHRAARHAAVRERRRGSARGDDERRAPAAREMTQTTLPAANAAIQDLRRTSEALRLLTEKLESQGAGSLLGGGKLPDYQP